MYIVFIIILLLREFFWLLPIDLVVLPDVIRISDAGLLLMFIVVVYAIGTNSRRITYLKSSFTPVIIGFVVLSLLNIYISNINYEQPFSLGFRAIRANFFYLLFFAVILTIDNRKKLNRFIRWIMILCFILTGFTVLQFAVPGLHIFHTDNAGIFEKRFGMSRFINPGLDMVAFACFIAIARFIQSGTSCGLSCMITGAIFSLQIMLSQTRAYLLSFPAAMMISMTVTGKFRWLMITSWCFVMGSGTFILLGQVNPNMSSNFLTKLYESSYSETMSQHGTVGQRFAQAQSFWKIGMEHPVNGSGVISPLGKAAIRLNYPVFRTDLGYVIMFSQYGILGIAWLVWLSLVYFRKVRHIYRLNTDSALKALVLALMTHYVFMVISFVTLPHFILGAMIVTVVLNLAILEVVHRLAAESAEQVEGIVYAAS